jgi:hypothetical protein
MEVAWRRVLARENSYQIDKIIYSSGRLSAASTNQFGSALS